MSERGRAMEKQIGWNKAMSELEDAKNYIEDYVIECATRLVEEQEEAILKTIQHIGGSVFIDITVDKNKVIEALTDYQKKIKGKSESSVDEVKHGKWFLLDECSNEGVYCSVCSKKVYKKDYANQKLKSNYCPNCGAKMDLD